MITFSWNSVPNATAYSVAWAPTLSGNKKILVASQAATSYSFDGSHVDDPYYVNRDTYMFVRALDGSNYVSSDWASVLMQMREVSIAGSHVSSTLAIGDYRVVVGTVVPSFTITPDKGYQLTAEDISIVNNGVDITSQVYNESTHTVSSFVVNGSVQVLATAVQAQLAAPVISLSGSVVSWSAVPDAESYRLYVNGQFTSNLGNELSVDLSQAIALKVPYTVNILAHASGFKDSELSNTISYTPKPDAPVLTLDGNTLSWTAIPSATRYMLVAVSDNLALSKTKTVDADTTSLDLTTWIDLAPSSWVIGIIAYVGDVRSDTSDTVTYVNTLQLAAPTTINITENVLTWNNVANNSGYEILYRRTDGSGEIYQTDMVDADVTQHTLTVTTAGTYSVTIVTIGTGSYTDSAESAAVTYTIQNKLATPTIALSSDGTTLQIVNVENATSYDIYVNGEYKTNVARSGGSINPDFTTATPQELKNAVDQGIAATTYAVGSTRQITLKNGQVITPAEQARIRKETSKMKFKKNIQFFAPALTTYDLRNLSLTVGSSYSITVKAKANGFTESNASSAVTFASKDTLTTPVLTNLSADGICKFSFPNDTRAYAYKIFVDGEQKTYPTYWSADLQDGIYTVTMSSACFPTVKTYSITAQAYSQDGDYFDSALSAPLSFTPLTQLAAPTIALNADGKTLEIADVANATSYDIYVDGALKTNVGNGTVTFEKGSSFNYTQGTNREVQYSRDGVNWATLINFNASSSSVLYVTSLDNVGTLYLRGSAISCEEDRNNVSFTFGGQSYSITTGNSSSFGGPTKLTVTGATTITFSCSVSCCFVAGTKVVMADETEKNIEDIKDGDMVLSYDVETKTLKASKVVGTPINYSTGQIMTVKLADGTEIRSTLYHPYYTKEGFKSYTNYNGLPALTESDFVMNDKGDFIAITSLSTTNLANNETTYNLSVEGTENYFVGKSHVLVHNKPC